MIPHQDDDDDDDDDDGVLISSLALEVKVCMIFRKAWLRIKVWLCERLEVG